MDWGKSRVRVQGFESTNFYFLADKYLAENFYANLLLIIVENVCTQICIFKHPRFQYKHNFMKLTSFSGAKNKGNQAKLLTDSESTTKINVWSGWALFLILLTFGSGFQTMTKQNNEQFQKLQKQDAHITIMAVFRHFKQMYLFYTFQKQSAGYVS